MTTNVTLMTGETLEVRGQYEDLKAYLTTGEKREVTLATGERLTLATGLIGLIRERATETAKATFGFSRALEA